MRKILALLAFAVVGASCASINRGPFAPGRTPMFISTTRPLLQLRQRLSSSGHRVQRLLGMWILPRSMAGGVVGLYLDQHQHVVIAKFKSGLGSSGELSMVDLTKINGIQAFLPVDPDPQVRYIRFVSLPHKRLALNFEIQLEGPCSPDAKCSIVVLSQIQVGQRLEPVFSIVRSATHTVGNVCHSTVKRFQTQILRTDINRDGFNDLQLVKIRSVEVRCPVDSECDASKICKSKRSKVVKTRLWVPKDQRYSAPR